MGKGVPKQPKRRDGLSKKAVFEIIMVVVILCISILLSLPDLFSDLEKKKNEREGSLKNAFPETTETGGALPYGNGGVSIR